MAGLTSQKQVAKEELDKLTKELDKDNNSSTESNLGIILLTIFATISMGILLFLFK